ncbi:MAG: tetratricopeptide repeat protein [Planctomycetota bacterium]|nr:tetratricopeptide repeat protein [Planctomycetota bacterium]
MPRSWMLTPLALLLVITGCQRAALVGEYATVAADPRRDTERAREKNNKAVALISNGRLEEAEKVLKEALTADVFFGPAHSNLGTVYYRQQKFYLAAWEFQYAAKLMPHQPEPRNNLGLVFEAVGRLDEAAKWYDEAVALEPDNPEILGNLARTLIRNGRRDDRTRQVLSDLVLKDTRPDWVAWAREQLALIPSPQPKAVNPDQPGPGQ